MAAQVPSNVSDDANHTLSHQDFSHSLSPTGDYNASSFSESLQALTGDDVDSLLDAIDHDCNQCKTEGSGGKSMGSTIAQQSLSNEEDEHKKQGLVIEHILDEIEMQEISSKVVYTGDSHVEKLRRDSLAMMNQSIERKKRLVLLKQRTFEHILRFEGVIATHARRTTKKATESADCKPWISTSALFHLPAEKDSLLHGYLRGVSAERESEFDRICHHIPAMMVRLIHRYYSVPNNQYQSQLQRAGICWTDHRVIVQHENVILWRWNETHRDGKRGQSTLIRDDAKGFTRFVHVEHERQCLSTQQVVEANPFIDVIQAVQHYHGEARSTVFFSGMEYLNICSQQQMSCGGYEQFEIEFTGPNHEYFAEQWVSCWNGIIDAEKHNETKMLLKVELFPNKKREMKSDGVLGIGGKLLSTIQKKMVPQLDRLAEYVEALQSTSDPVKHIESARLIRKLLSNETQPPIQEVIDCGIIQRLIYLMQYSPSPVVTFECAWSLTNLASGSREHTATLIKFDVIPALINVLKRSESIVEIKEQALWCLGNIAGDSPQCRDEVLQHDLLKHLLPLIRPYRLLIAREPIYAVKHNTVPQEIEKKTDDATKATSTGFSGGYLKGIWSKLGFTLCPTSTVTKKVSAMTQLQKEEKEKGKGMGVDQDEKQLIHEKEAGIMETSDGTLLCKRQSTFMRNMVWSLSNLNRGKPMPSLKYIILSLHCIDIMLKDPISHIAHPGHHQLLQDCCWTLSYITEYHPGSDHYGDGDLDDDDERKDDGLQLDVALVLLDSGIVDILIELLFHESDLVVHPALRTIGNIATGSDTVTNKLLQKAGIMEAIARLMQKTSKLAIKRETLWLISNITAGDIHHVDLVVKNPKVLHNVVDVILAEEQDCVRKEAVWALSNATANYDIDQIRLIVQCRGIDALVHWLRHCQEERRYGRVTTVCIDGLHNILRCGLMDALGMGGNLNLNAVIGQNAHNANAVSFENLGGRVVLQNILNDPKAPQDLQDRAQSIIDSYFSL